VRIYGVDFTCAPRRAKPITVASGVLTGKALAINAVERLETFAEFEALLTRPGPWIGGFDFPFSLPRELVHDLGWPSSWKALVRHCAAMSRQQFREALDGYRNTRQVGRRYAHRATDLPAGSSSPMKLVNPPVALMFHEGAPRIVAAGVAVPALGRGDPQRVALEAYPGLLARTQLGLREPYKSDTRSKHTAPRAAARRRIVEALERGQPLGITLRTRLDLVADGSGDTVDAVICAVQAAWAAGQPDYGLPRHVPRGEGWIISA
jgi:hypothetical protein